LPIRLLPDTRSDIQAEHILISMLDNIKPDAKQEPRRIWIDRRDGQRCRSDAAGRAAT